MKDFYVCLLYGLSATMMNISTKSLISTYSISPALILLTIQHIIIILLGYTKHYKVTWEEFKECGMISLLSLGNIVFGGIGMKYVNLPMYIALRKLCTAKIFFIDLFFSNQPIEVSSAIGVVGISIGALIAGFNDLTSEFNGYLIVFLANLMNALLLFQIRHAKEKLPSLISFKQVYLCSAISLPYTLVLIYTFDEQMHLAVSPYAHTWGFFFMVLYAGGLGVSCNYFLFKCTSEISPMATSVTGNAKDFISMIAGLWAFNDVQPNLLFVSGLFISMTGAVVYSSGKLVNGKKEAKSV